MQESFEGTDRDKLTLTARKSYLKFMTSEKDTINSSECSGISECCASELQTLISTSSHKHSLENKSVQSQIRTETTTVSGPLATGTQDATRNYEKALEPQDGGKQPPRSILDKFKSQESSNSGALSKGMNTGAIRKKRIARITYASDNPSRSLSREKILIASEQNNTYTIIPDKATVPVKIMEPKTTEPMSVSWADDEEVTSMTAGPPSKTTTASNFHEMIDFKSVSTKRNKTIPTNDSPITPVKNYYGILANLEQKAENTTTNNTKTYNQKPKIEKIPPIILPGQLQDYGSFIKFMRELLGHSNFHVAFNAANVKILVKTKADHMKVINKLKSDNEEYITYPHRDERVKKLVLKAAPRMKPEDIVNELDEIYNIQVLSVVPLKGKNPINFSYLITFPFDTNMAEIHKVEGLLNLRVKWERYVRKTEFIQCHKCQQYGHTQTYCNMKPKCVKCAQDHITAECPHLERLENPKCANCGGAHTASFSQCPKLLSYLETRHENMTRRTNQRNPPPQQTQEQKPQHQRPPAKKVTSGMSYAEIAHGKKNYNNPPQIETPTTNENDLDDLNTLMQEIKELNTICNIRQMIDMVRKLKIDLKSANSNLDKLNILLQYSENTP